MSATALPATSGTEGGEVDAARLEAALRERVDGEVRFDVGSRGAYSTDSSNYRQVPIGVVVPYTIEAGVAAVAVCHEFRVPMLSRGGGTSLAGECCNTAVVIDWSKHCNRIESLDADARRAVVQPGVVLDQLDRAAGVHGLMFGPRPATHGHCTFGGMIGNNSCGSTAQAYGKTADNVVRMEVLCADGTRFWVGEGDDEREPGSEREREIRTRLAQLGRDHADEIRARFPDIPRRVSGYNLDQLLPDRDGDLAAALCGSESTLVTVLRAEVALVTVPRAKALILLGYDSIADAGDAVPSIVAHDPHIVEGMDRGLVDDEKALGMDQDALAQFPDGDGWLLVQLADDDHERLHERVKALVAAVGDTADVRTVENEDHARALIAAREDALGATAWSPGKPSAWPGWEDAAVPPDRVGDYLRDFRGLLERHGYGTATVYGHFGQGCIHTRIPFDLTTERGVGNYRRFVEEAAHLVVSYGGSLSGEHGDGQARGPLLPIMFGEDIIELFREVKALFDPHNLMNPGKVIDSAPVDAHLRFGAGFSPLPTRDQMFSYPDDGGLFERATMRCVGVGKCRDHTQGVMCPSYRATGEEEHSTRGRARLLFEMVNRRKDPIDDVWRSDAVHDALDLCLSCKGCKSDCPVDVDMATYKAEFLYHHYRGRLRPRAHYSMGWLPLWARLVRLAPSLVNALAHAPVLRKLASRIAGLDPDRPIPYFAGQTFAAWYRRRGPRGSGIRGEVLLWPDTFTDNLHPGVARAAVEVLEDAGYRVALPDGLGLCCGLTWISTGQLPVAKAVLRRTAHALAPALRRGTPLVVLEPSCAAVFRSDATDLLPDDDAVSLLRDRTRTLAELLHETEGWRPPRLDRDAVFQPHCHQHAVLGTDADDAVLADAGVTARTVDGCCGLAGNFGFEQGHLDVSLAVAETELVPALRDADQDAVVLADGFSCRTQIEHTGTGRQGMHLAELLAAGIRSALPDTPKPEYGLVERPGRPQRIRGRGDMPRPFVARDGKR